MRDCEAIFVGAPQSFQQEDRKIHFAVRFISEPMRVVWEGYCNEKKQLNPVWMPTWGDLKSTMLDCLGPEAIRRLGAHSELKSLKQAQDQDPNDLHAALHVLWSEMGPGYGEGQRKMDLLGALLPRIQSELLSKGIEQYPTTTSMVVAARFYWNRRATNNSILNRLNRPPEEKPKTTPEIRAGTPKPRKRPKRPRSAQPDPKSAKRDQSETKGVEKACWNCGKPGHLQRDCTQPEKPKSDLTNQKSGKGKGRRS